jgi:hypothetical protein
MDNVLNTVQNFLNANAVYIICVLLVMLVVLIILTVILFAKFNDLKEAYEEFMQGRDGKSLEEILTQVVEDNKRVKAQCRNDIQAIAEMKRGLKDSYKKIGIVKYDTLRGMTGKLSFSLALLDGEDSGFVLTSMHTQDGCYSYLKEIIHGESHAILSNEEKDALNMAMNSELVIPAEESPADTRQD